MDARLKSLVTLLGLGGLLLVAALWGWSAVSEPFPEREGPPVCVEYAFADGDDSAFSDAEQAVIRYAAKLSSEPAAMTDADTQELRDAGYSDRQIVDITLAAAARNFFSRALLALAVPTDEMPGLEPSLADALVRSARDGGRRQATGDRQPPSPTVI